MTSLEEQVGGSQNVLGGPFGSKLTQNDYTEAGVPVIRGSNMVTGERWLGGEFAYVSEAKVEADLKRNLAQPGDIIVTQRGTLGQVAIVPDRHGFDRYVISQSQMAVRVPKDIAHRDFVFYFLKSPQFAAYVYTSTIQTGVPHINLGILRSAPATWPEREQQEQIASVLAALDEKIELNRRVNVTLEAMARAIFKDWFVDFGPTRAKAEGRVPYLAPQLWDLFPNALDDEEKPVGWAKAPLDEVADFLNGLALQKFPASDLDGSLPVIKIAELRRGITSKSSRASRHVPQKYIVRDGDFLFSWSGSLLARFWTQGDGALNQHLFKVTSDRFPTWFFSQWVHHHLEEFQAIAASKATTMGHIQRRHLKEAMIVLPPDGVLPLLGQAIAPLVERTIRNELENRTLAETRDLLLPNLMSGEIRVRDAEMMAETAV